MNIGMQGDGRVTLSVSHRVKVTVPEQAIIQTGEAKGSPETQNRNLGHK
jgi:hypothetical protein